MTAKRHGRGEISETARSVGRNDYLHSIDRRPGRRARKFLLQDSDYSLEELMELSLIQNLVGDLMSAHSVEVARPLFTPLAALHCKRPLNFLSELAKQETLTVLEIGHDNGYLGAFLVASGFRYIGVELDPKAYAWQSDLLGRISLDDMIELGEKKAPPPALHAPVVHLPWDVFSAAPMSAAVDVAILNVPLDRLASKKLGIMLRHIRLVLKSSNVGLLLCHDMSRVGSLEKRLNITAMMAEIGWHRWIAGEPWKESAVPFAIFRPAENPPNPRLVNLADPPPKAAGYLIGGRADLMPSEAEQIFFPEGSLSSSALLPAELHE